MFTKWRFDLPLNPYITVDQSCRCEIEFVHCAVFAAAVHVVFVQNLQDDEDDNMEDGIKLITSILGPANIHHYPKILQLVMADGAYAEGRYRIRTGRCHIAAVYMCRVVSFLVKTCACLQIQLQQLVFTLGRTVLLDKNVMMLVRALILYRRRRFINHLLTYLLTYLWTAKQPWQSL